MYRMLHSCTPTMPAFESIWVEAWAVWVVQVPDRGLARGLLEEPDEGHVREKEGLPGAPQRRQGERCISISMVGMTGIDDCGTSCMQAARMGVCSPRGGWHHALLLLIAGSSMRSCVRCLTLSMCQYVCPAHPQERLDGAVPLHGAHVLQLRVEFVLLRHAAVADQGTGRSEGPFAHSSRRGVMV